MLVACASPAVATVWVKRTLPVHVPEEAITCVEDAAARLYDALAGCEERRLCLRDEPGPESHHILEMLEEAWRGYVNAMLEWGCIDDERLWMKPLLRPKVPIWGRMYDFVGLPVPDEHSHKAPQLIAALMATMRAELESSQKEHLDYVRKTQEAREPAPWELEDSPPPFILPPLLP